MLLNIGQAKPEGWIKEHLIRDRDGITGNLDKLCEDAKSGIFTKNRVEHKIDGYWSSWWPGETEGNWIIAFIELAVALKEKDLLERATTWVNDCIAYQDPDGYMGIYLPGERYGNAERNGDLWTQSRLMMAFLSLYKHNGDKAIIAALERLTDLTVKQYGPLAGGRSFYQAPCEDGSKTHGLMVIEPILLMYKELGKQEYLDFCEWLYLDYSKYDSKFPTSDIAMHNALDPDIDFVGHGPHTCEQLRIPLLLHAYTKNPVYKAVYTAAAQKIRKVTTLSGSCKSDELIGVFKSYIPKDERVGFNMEGCIPIPSAGYEFCSTTELFYSYMAGFDVLNDSKYADWTEWMVFNAAMAARRADGKAIQYLCADNGLDATRKKGERWDYSPTHIDAAVCCAPNAGKLMPAYLGNMWRQNSKGELFVALYGPSSLIADGYEIKQDTNYPFENEIRFEFVTQQPKNLTINFRIPEWSNGFELIYNNKPADNSAINSTFNNGDKIILRFTENLELKKAADGTFALSHGPLLYALDVPATADDYFAYEHEGFYDTDYLPAEGTKWNYTFTHDAKRRTKVVLNKDATAFPWESSPIKLETIMLSDWAVPEKVELIPIGCTLLKRTTFPKA